MSGTVVDFTEAHKSIMNGGRATCLANGKTYSKCKEHGHEGTILVSDAISNVYRGDFSFNSLEIESEWIVNDKEEMDMNEKHEFQVGDLVRLKSVEEILALGFWFNEFGGISYPISKEVLLFDFELKYCGKEFVVDDFSWKGHIELKSTNSDERIVNICPSVLELVEVEEEDENTYECQLPTLNVGDKIRIKTHEELLASGWEFIDGDYFFTGEGFVSDTIIIDNMKSYLGGIFTIETVHMEQDGIADFWLEEDIERWHWTSYMIAEVVEENTYEEVQEEDYKPYCAVVNDAPESNNTYEPTTWNKERIQRGFENLEMYNKGYADGFQQALELMKEEFGVE